MTPESFRARTGSYFGQHVFCDIYAGRGTVKDHLRLLTKIFKYGESEEKKVWLELLHESPASLAIVSNLSRLYP